MNYQDRQQQKLKELDQQWQSITERIEAIVEQIGTTTDLEQKTTLNKRLRALKDERDALEPDLRGIEDELAGDGGRSENDVDADLDRVKGLIDGLLARLDALAQPQPPAYTGQDVEDYLDFLIQQCATLDPRRMRSGGGVVQQVVIPLEDVFVSLHADPDNPLEREADRRLLELDVEALAASERLEELSEEQRHNFRYRVLVNEQLMLSQRREHTDDLVDLADAFRRRRYLVLLGDPGSGKTTLSRWLALQFARALRDDQERVQTRQSDQKEPADLGPTRLPILLRVADFAEARRDDDDLPLADYLGHQPIQGQAPPVAPEKLHALFGDYLARGQAVVLLDGLDEITDPAERNNIVRAIEGFIAEYIRSPEGGGLFDGWGDPGADGEVRPGDDVRTLRRRWSRALRPGPAETGGSQVVVTSRVAGYRAAPLRGDLAHFTIQDMNDEAVECFCDRWTLAVERFLLRDTDLDDEAIQRRAVDEAEALKTAIAASPGVRKLAANPLLLTILALIHREQTRLPDQRIKLYQQAVQTLVEIWRDTGLAEAEVIDVLGPLALEIHETQPTGLATEAEVRTVVTRALADWHGYDPADRLPGKFKLQVEGFVRAVREQSGLLVARGEGLYGFMHLTFQEYFVARELTRDVVTAIESITAHLHRPRWREPLLLAVAYLSDTQRGAMGRVMEALLAASAEYEEVLHRNLLFAAACIPDAVWIPPRIVRRIVTELFELYTDELAGGRYPTLRGEIEGVLRPLTRDENAARIVDEVLIAALNAPDDERCHQAAGLVRAIEWGTPAVAQALLQSLPRDSAPGWPVDRALAHIAAHAPDALPTDRLPFRAACLDAPALWERLAQSGPLRALVLALYGAGYPFEAERIYRDSPLTPTILSALREWEHTHGSENANGVVDALAEALKPLDKQIDLYEDVQVALLALDKKDVVANRLQADAAQPELGPAVRSAGLRMLRLSNRAALAARAVRDDLDARAARAARAVRDVRDARDALAALAARDALAALDARDARDDLADQMWSVLWRALGSADADERRVAVEGLLSQGRISLSLEHLSYLQAYLEEASPWGGGG